MSLADEDQKEIEGGKKEMNDGAEPKKPVKKTPRKRSNTSPRQSMDQQQPETSFSLGQYENLLKSISKNMERQSKEIGNLQVQVTHLQKQLAAIDRGQQDTRRFIEDRGWKKKNKKK